VYFPLYLVLLIFQQNLDPQLGSSLVPRCSNLPLISYFLHAPSVFLQTERVALFELDVSDNLHPADLTQFFVVLAPWHKNAEVVLQTPLMIKMT
jgi:hypothetical protein